MIKKLFILTNGCGKIPQKMLETESIDVESIRSFFLEHNFEVILYKFDEFSSSFSDLKDKIQGSYFFYSSSQYPEYFSGIEDILLAINEFDGILIPKFIHFRAHENKFIQEFVKSNNNISTPRSFLFTSIEESEERLENLKYPVVAKLATGYGSCSVELIRTKNQALNFLNKNLVDVVKPRKNFLKRNSKIREYLAKHPLKVGKLIFQEFIDGIENDWKILIFGNKLFYLKRYFKKNDFRASGSGNFDNSTPPSLELMKFAMTVKEKLDTPWVSLDIIQKNKDLYLIEYQCVHFGLYTAIKCESYFENIGNEFIEVKKQVDVDKLFAEELYQYILNENELKND